MKQALKNREPVKENFYLVAVGKATLADGKCSRKNLLNGQIEKGIVITKYGHIQGDIPRIECFEAGHPVPDTNTLRPTESDRADRRIAGRRSGIISAFRRRLRPFEKPLISTEELSDITKSSCLHAGADIVEMNTIRKRLSAVKGGKFAGLCEPAAIFADCTERYRRRSA